MAKAEGNARRSAAEAPLSQATRSHSLNSSLVVASLAIGRVLADRDGATFRAQGTCMYPTIRPHDVLRIRSCGAADIALGDIAVCRAQTYLFSHRVIERGECDGRAYIVTRPDRSPWGSDGPTFDENLLGMVISIERGGSKVPLDPRVHRWALRLYHHARLTLVETRPRGRLWLATALGYVQDLPAYRRIARRWFASGRWHPSFAVRIPLNATLGDAVYRQLELAEFDPGATHQDRSVDRWTLTLRVHDSREPAAWTTFARVGDNSWRVEGAYVRVRYRGMGLDDALLRRAEMIVREVVSGGQG